MTRLGPDDLQPAFARLKAIHGLKGAYALKDDQSDEATVFRAEWLRQLTVARIRPEELIVAVDTWLADKREGWPTPGDIKSLVWQQYGKAPRPIEVMGRADDFVWCLATRPDESTFHRYYPRCAIPPYAHPVGDP